MACYRTYWNDKRGIKYNHVTCLGHGTPMFCIIHCSICDVLQEVSIYNSYIQSNSYLTVLIAKLSSFSVNVATASFIHG